MKKLYLLNSQNAHMPELVAYPEVLKGDFDVNRVDDYDGDYADGIFWCFMGLYRKRNNAGFLIHDYRSLSTGSGAAMKDWMKKRINPRPDLRIFLNESVEEIMAFHDGVPSFRLDMGVPEILLNQETAVQERSAAYDYRFGYIGEISLDRGIDKMLEAFTQSAYRSETMVLIGRVEPEIQERYRSYSNITFRGTMPQEEVFGILKTVEFGLSVLPNRRPYKFQTATKLLEYASLGMKILANRCVSMERTSETYGINVRWSNGWIFDDLNHLDQVADNNGFETSQLSWSTMMNDSGLMHFLRKVKVR